MNLVTEQFERTHGARIVVDSRPGGKSLNRYLALEYRANRAGLAAILTFVLVYGFLWLTGRHIEWGILL